MQRACAEAPWAQQLDWTPPKVPIQAAGCPPVMASSAGAGPLQQHEHEAQSSGHGQVACQRALT